MSKIEPTLLTLLKQRQLFEAVTDETFDILPNGRGVKFYLGYDPTADSLHLGHLASIRVLKWFQKYGCTPYLLLGGSTGKIGDPSGKSKERPVMESEVLELNVKKLKHFFDCILGQDALIEIGDNFEWYKDYPLIDFLSDIGKHFRVNVMLNKESVKTRLHSEGISFTEFSYQLLQAFDFYYLFTTKEVVLQIGGSDQWGNITAGVELIRKKINQRAYGLTYPLITRQDGKKFGKTEEGVIWLSPHRCSPYDFYQYIYRVEDGEVIKLMKMLTEMDLEEIDRFEKEMKTEEYLPNSAQKRLAYELTETIHGKSGILAAMKATCLAAPGIKERHEETELDPHLLRENIHHLPHLVCRKEEVIQTKLVDIFVKSGLLPSKAAAIRLIAQGGVYLNNQRIEDPSAQLKDSCLIGGEFFILSVGKKKKMFFHLR